ncbi:MAG: PPC domain-containing protein [Aggregatilineales bacterium]
MRRGLLAALLGLTALIGLPLRAQQDDSGGLAFGAVNAGRITNASPRAAYYFEAQRGEVIAISLAVTEGDLDPVLLVLDDAGAVLASLDDSSGSRVPQIASLVIPRTGRYFVVVARFGYALGTTVGAYELRIERVGVSSASGSALRYGDQVINRISDMQPQLYYTFRARRGDIVNIYMRRVSGDLDSYLQVVDERSFVVADNDDLIGALLPLDAGIERLVIEQDGTYVIVASRYGQAAGTSSGSFVLTLEEARDSGLGNTPQTAHPLLLGDVVDGTITGDRFNCYYRFQASANDLVTVRMSRTGGSLDPFLTIADDNLVTLATDDDGGGGQNARIDQFLVPADGVYYIIASRFEGQAGTTAGSYRLELQSLGNAFDGVPEGVARIGYGVTMTGNISDDAPEALYAFRGGAGDVITVTMNRGDGDLDPMVSLLDASRNVLARDDDGGPGQNARIERFTLPASGVYYIRAGRYDGAEGNANTSGSYILVLARRLN